jgi:predicted O-methyltransferase YrrM
MRVTTLTAEDYGRAFARECEHAYPLVDALEQTICGYAVARATLLAAARVLACPVKAHDPNWQHGRVLYAVARQYLAPLKRRVLMLDIGTAKGFSALCLQWALNDSAVQGTVVSVDVIDPCSRVSRNTVAEVEGLKTLREILAPWPESDVIHFEHCTGLDWLSRYAGRVDFAFVDGKHAADVVWKEGTFLADRQQTGDVVVFDDVHLPLIRSAVASLSAYRVEWVTILPQRAYAIARRK